MTNQHSTTRKTRKTRLAILSTEELNSMSTRLEELVQTLIGMQIAIEDVLDKRLDKNSTKTKKAQ
jgi:hypothetical protein